jgi:hypothetical protein
MSTGLECRSTGRRHADVSLRGGTGAVRAQPALKREAPPQVATALAPSSGARVPNLRKTAVCAWFQAHHEVPPLPMKALAVGEKPC